jgi:hypothetical protein
MESGGRFRRSAELVGVVGIILSLAFVGFEVRQNTRVAKAEAYRSFAAEVNEWYFRMTDPDMAELLGGSFGSSVDDLNETEWMQMFGWWMALFRIYEGLHKEVTEGVLEESALGLLNRGDYSFLILQEMWPEISRNLTPDFVAYVAMTHGLER